MKNIYQFFPILLLITACATQPTPTPEPSSTPTLEPTETPIPSATATTTHTPEPSSTPEPTATPTQTPTPAPLSSKEIFNSVSHTVAYVETEVGQGSGILLDSGMVLTNAHVVWPYDKVRVLFSDGSDFEDVPVVNWDLMADLAVLGPIETDIEPVQFSTREDLETASEVYLVGYPGEVDEFPQPTITRGLISRIREWEQMGITFFQTDATIGGGQSGGMMVTEYGEPIGVSTFMFGDAGFGLVASANDIGPRIEHLISGEETAGPTHRTLPTNGAKRSHSPVFIDNRWDTAHFLLNEPLDTEVEISADGQRNDIELAVYDIYGNPIVFADDTLEGQESVSFITAYEGPYFVTLRQFGDRVNLDAISIESNKDLLSAMDLDDGHAIKEGSKINGNIDYPTDLDFYKLVLTEGDKVNVIASSISIDPILIIGREGAADQQLLFDSDTGGGMFGLDAEISFIAPDSGIYHVVVGDFSNTGTGGYILEVREHYTGAPTPMVPLPTPEPIDTEFGDMDVFFGQDTNYAFLYPLHWTAGGFNQNWWDTFCFEPSVVCLGGDGGMLIVSEESVAGTPITTLDEYVQLYLNIFEESGMEVLGLQSLETDAGLSGTVVTMDIFGLVQIKRFMIMQEDTVFNISYMTEPDNAAELWPLAEFSFSTLDEYE